MSPAHVRHYNFLLEVRRRKFRPNPRAVAELIADLSIAAGRPRAAIPRQADFSVLLEMDQGDVTRALSWLKDRRVIDEKPAGAYAITAPALWTVSLRAPLNAERAEISARLNADPAQGELRDLVRGEPLDAPLLADAVSQTAFNDFAGADASNASGATPAKAAEASASGTTAEKFDAGLYFETLRDNPASATEYLKRFPLSYAAYQAGAEGKVFEFPSNGPAPVPVQFEGKAKTSWEIPNVLGNSQETELGNSQGLGKFPRPPCTTRAPEAPKAKLLYEESLSSKAWARLEGIDSDRLLLDQHRRAQWLATVEADAQRVLDKLEELHRKGWRDKYGRQISSRLGYLANALR